jgi:hypothetical protein
MNQEDVRRYRAILEKEYSFVNLKIEITLTYVSAAALGFFVFLDTSYLKGIAANYRFLLVIGLAFLFLSFILMLIRKSTIMKYEFELITFVERMQPNSESQEQELISVWDKTYMNWVTIQTFCSLGLVLGIGLHLAFLFLNI